MKEADLKLYADMLRRIADEIERGDWYSVTVQANNHLRDRPRTWHDEGQYRGAELCGRTVSVRLSSPKETKCEL